jgi:hypothetical protein
MAARRARSNNLPVHDDELYGQFWRSLPPSTQAWMRGHPQAPLPQGIAFELVRRSLGFVTITETSQGMIFTLHDQVWEWIGRHPNE